MKKTIQIDEYGVRRILQKYVKLIKTPTIIVYKFDDSGVVNLYSNNPGSIIGKGGKNINNMITEMKTKCNVTHVYIYEIQDIVSNFNIY